MLVPEYSERLVDPREITCAAHVQHRDLHQWALVEDVRYLIRHIRVAVRANDERGDEVSPILALGQDGERGAVSSDHPQ